MLQNYRSNKQITALKGKISIDGDKSCSHRALILASQMIGESIISGLLESDDVIATKNALMKLGVKITKKEGNWYVIGNGLASYRSPDDILDFANSGTGVRLLMGALSTLKIEAVLTGDKSLRSRPMKRVTDPLAEFQTKFNLREQNYLPITIKGNGDSIAIEHQLQVPSAQVKSALMLAAINANGTSTIIENIPTRDHTEIMMKYLGFDIKEEYQDNKKIINIKGGVDVKAKNIDVSGDPSSAAFIVAAALLVKDSHIIVKNVLINDSRIGFYEILQKMGAQISFLNKRNICAEEVADIEVKYSKLKAIEVEAKFAPRTIDEYPILSILATQASGATIMKGLSELKVKESDRLGTMANNLKLCGVSVEIGDDWLKINNQPNIKATQIIKTFHDHRIAMSFIILGLITDEGIEVDDIEMINTSFPNFFNKLKQIGVK